MIICVECHTEMKVEKNGVVVRYGGNHCYSGDSWKCPTCGKMVINCNNSPYPSDEPLDPKHDIEMTQ
jgi:hypothetical protein